MTTDLVPTRRRGAPKGNVNAVKHGRHSAKVNETRALVRAAQLPALDDQPEQDGFRLPVSYARVIRWSQEEFATLQVAALKQAGIVRWRLAIVEALLEGHELPLPPAVLPTQREAALLKICIEQRRLLVDSVDELAESGFDSLPERIAGNAEEAIDALTDWGLIAGLLSPEMLDDVGLDYEAEMKRLEDIYEKAFGESPKLRRYVQMSEAIDRSLGNNQTIGQLMSGLVDSKDQLRRPPEQKNNETKEQSRTLAAEASTPLPAGGKGLGEG